MKLDQNNKVLTAYCRFLVLPILAFIALQSPQLRAEEFSPGAESSNKNSPNHGIWFPLREKKAQTPSTGQVIQRDLKKLKTLGYLSGYQSAPTKSGVTKYDPSAAYNGVNIVVSGHKPYAAMIDMKGNTLHEWNFDFAKSGLSAEGLIVNNLVDENYKNYWRRVFLYENGSILAIYDYMGLIKLDSHSSLKWAYPGRAHHDIFVDGHGAIWLLTAEKKILPSINPDIPVLEEFICKLNSDGQQIEKISLLKCFENSKFASFLKNMQPNDPDAAAMDVFHTNSLQLLDGTLEEQDPAFTKGNILVSIRQLSLLAIVDPDKKSIVWVREGTWKSQHEAQLIKNGHILLFDNMGKGAFSRVLEIDPFTNAIIWSYEASPPKTFFSPIVGAQQRLPNGNTLITDTVGGKAFEVTEDGNTVWEYINPHRSGKNNELIAALFQVTRHQRKFIESWLDKTQPQ